MTTPAPAPAPVEALQTALAAEHAAVWALQLVTAFLPDAHNAAIAEAATAHQARRDTAARLLRDQGATPAAAEPAYTGPAPVRDEASALALLITAEEDLTGAWLAVIERTDDGELRGVALDALTDSAVRAARWRVSAAARPATVPLPGQPRT
jgi:Domain of unknown function (DUF4439)